MRGRESERKAKREWRERMRIQWEMEKRVRKGNHILTKLSLLIEPETCACDLKSKSALTFRLIHIFLSTVKVIKARK